MKGRLAVLITLTLLISGFYYYFLSYQPAEKPVTRVVTNKNLHLAGNKTSSINNVDARVVYFVPKDLANISNWSWQDRINTVMNQQIDFFRFQLGNNIYYKLYPKPIIGLEIHQFYDGEATDNGNPNALISVREEVLKRVFNEYGDLYDKDFSTSRTDRFQIMIIIYEGTGASAMIYQNNPIEGPDVVKIETDGPPAIILSSAFLNSPYYVDFGSTILAHEIGHSFGLSDSNERDTGVYTENDLMGEGRRRTLNSTYISDKNKKLLGAE